MVDETHLRRLAGRCLWLSKNCYDLAAAAEMRLISAEMSLEAIECEKNNALKPQPH